MLRECDGAPVYFTAASLEARQGVAGAWVDCLCGSNAVRSCSDIWQCQQGQFIADACLISLAAFLRACGSLSGHPDTMGDTDSAPKRRIGTSIFSRILFSFISPTITKAKRKGRLQEDEVPEHTMDLDTSLLFRRFDEEWQRQQKKKKPSMVHALVAGRWILIVATGVGYIVAQATTLAGPLLLKQIVAGLTCRRNADTSSCDSEQTLYMCAPG